jgi:uncharacterized protein (DUF169 family)
MNGMVSEYLRTGTFPVAVKIYKKNEEVPAGIKAKTPLKDFGHRLALCQGITMARKLGTVLKFTREDQSCPLAQIITGYIEEPDLIRDGSVVYPLYTGSMEAGKITQSTTPKMPSADTGAIVVAPLQRANFEPDVIIIYGNPAQVVRMVQGALYNEGGYIESRFAGRGACGGEITVPYSQQKYNVVAPGGGERVFALTSDDEMAFAVPSSKFRSFMEGVIATHKGGVARMPTPIAGVSQEPKWPSTYNELCKYVDSL